MITDRDVGKTARVAEKELVVPIITAVAQDDVLAFAFRPGHAFLVTDVQAYCLDTVVTVSVDVKIGAVSVLDAPIDMEAATRKSGVLADAGGLRRGNADEDLNIHYTSDADGALTNGFVVVRYRPRPLNGEAFPVS